MTRTLTICALACVLLVGAAVASILIRDSVPSAPAVSDMDPAAPVSNKQGKKDKLPMAVVMAALPPQPVDPALAQSLRSAFAPDTPVVVAPPLTPSLIPAQPPAKPKLAKAATQKDYTLLSDAQIAAIKGRLNLTASQQQSWPAVEDALRAVAKRIHETKQSNPRAGSPPIDPGSNEVQQLKSAAMPLLFSLREDQKREVRSLARIIGLEQVASQI